MHYLSDTIKRNWNSRWLAMAVALLAIGFTLHQPVRAEGLKAVPGTTVSLVPLKDFTPASGFAGFENQENRASILIVELPGQAHAQVSALFANRDAAKTNFAKQRITVEELEEVSAPAGKAPLVVGTQTIAAGTFDKWIALFKGEKTVMITVQAPDDAELDHAEVKAMLATVTLGAAPELADKLKSLPFTIKAVEPFRVLDTILGSGVMMTVGPLDTDPQETQPLLIATYQLSASPGADKPENTARHLLLMSLKHMADAKVTATEKLRFAGHDGVLLKGEVKGGRKRFVQYFTFGPDKRFIRLLASADADVFEKLEPAIKAIADSVAYAGRK